jgi:hypothetical protein
MDDSPVMLSAAKHLAAQRDRPFAALRVTVEGRFIAPRWISRYPDYFVNLFIKEAYHPSPNVQSYPGACTCLPCLLFMCGGILLFVLTICNMFPYFIVFGNSLS